MSYSWLPALLAEIAEVAGLDAALALARARGGSRITIPAAPGKGHWLCKLVGLEAARALAEHFATSDGASRRRGAILDLPVGPSEAECRRAVEGRAADVLCGEAEVAISIVGNPGVWAESLVRIRGVSLDVDGDWITKG